MQLHLIQYIVTSKIIHALLWTLVHSLWQGIVIAFVAALLVNSTKNSVALVRYKLLGYLLCSFVIISIATFCYEINLPGSNNVNTQTINQVSANYIVSAVAHNPLKDFFTKAILLLQVYKSVIVLMWMMIVVFKCINMLAGLRTLYRLKHRRVFDAGIFWNEKLKELASSIGIKKPVILLKSAIAEIPMMAGHFKPVILFPAAAFTTLSPEDIEAILLHELAHIRRNDYLINMLQNFAEIIFFFNPAVLWLSSLVKEERENCCDDVALNQTKNKKQFIHALVAFKDHETAIQHAAFFSGKKYYLLNRLKRIITNNNKTLNSMEKIFLAAGIIITVFTTVAFTKIKQPFFANADHVIQQEKSDFLKDRSDTTEPTIVDNNESKTVINYSFNDKHYKLVETNGKKELYINDIKVPDNNIGDYKDVIQKLEQQIVIDKKNQDEAIKAQAEALAKQAEAMKENSIAVKKQAADLNNRAQELNDSYMNESAQAGNDAKAQSDDLRKQAEELKAEAEELQNQALSMKNEVNSKPNPEEIEIIKAQSVQAQKEDLKAQTEYIKQQDLMNKAQLDKQMEQLKTEQKKLAEQSEIMKQQQLQMKAEMEKQAEIMKQQQIQMKADMEKQNEQLKEQHEALIKQLNRESDSINTAPVKPNK